MVFQPSELPDEESALRRMMSDAHGMPFQPLKTLDEARHCVDGVAILEGDDGGQIYVVVPASQIKCSDEDALIRLLYALDAMAWSCNKGEGASICYERRSVGSGVAGGMGGGAVIGDLWLHDDFRDISQQIRKVVAGIRDSIELSGG